MKKRKENQVVYVLLNKTKRSFFIAQGTEETLRETYRHHLKSRREYSEKFITDCRDERPCLFILEQIAPDEQANLLLVWLRILQENGYVCFNSPVLIEMAEHLYIYSTIAYNKRKGTELSELLSCAGCLVPAYNKQTCPRHPTYSEDVNKPSVPRKPAKDGQTIIRFRVSEEEYEIIRKRAQAQNLSISAYVKKAARESKILYRNFPEIAEHSRYVADIRDHINNISFTIEVMNNYQDRDIAAVVNYMKALADSEKKLLETLKDQLKQDKKEQP